MTERWDTFTFISYSKTDQAWVQVLAEDLVRLGLRVYYDEWQIREGDLVNPAIEAGLAGCNAGIVVCSDDTFTRPYVREEYAALLNNAVLKNHRLIAVLYRLTDIGTLPPGLRSRRWLDLRGVEGAPYQAAVQRLADALLGRPIERPRAGTPLAAPAASATLPERVGVYWEARTVLADILLTDHPVVACLDRHLGATLEATPDESTRQRAERLAAVIDDLGAGASAAKDLVLACYHAQADLPSPRREDGKKILRDLLAHWLQHRYGPAIGAQAHVRVQGACEDLHIPTPNHSIAATAIGHHNRQPVRYVNQSGVVRPRGALPPPVFHDGQIRDADAVADAIADTIAEQGDLSTDPNARRRRAKHRLNFVRNVARGDDRDPKHLPIPTEGLRKRDRETLNLVLSRLKAIYPALQLVELGEHEDEHEGDILDPLLAIFGDAPA